MTLEQFKEKYVNKAVHCNTEEKAKELLALALKHGWSAFRNEEIIEITYWHSHEENTCYRIDYDNTMGWSNLSFYKSLGFEVVEFESEKKKVKKTKKVFDLGLYVDWSIKNKRGHSSISDDIKFWALEWHGKTEEEMRKTVSLFGKHVLNEWMEEVEIKHAMNEWMKEVEVKYELSEKEIEVLKALKVLDFEWIARDWDNTLFAYVSKPFKKGAYFDGNGGNNTGLEDDLFTFISWEDGEPTNIEELLKYA